MMQKGYVFSQHADTFLLKESILQHI
jgi:hypothetical protein